jgi:hypothetical protein
MEFERIIFEQAVEHEFRELVKRMVDARNTMKKQCGAVLLARSVDALRINISRRAALISWYIQKQETAHLTAQSQHNLGPESKPTKKKTKDFVIDDSRVGHKINLHQTFRASANESRNSRPPSPSNKTHISGSHSRRNSYNLFVPGNVVIPTTTGSAKLISIEALAARPHSVEVSHSAHKGIRWSPIDHPSASSRFQFPKCINDPTLTRELAEPNVIANHPGKHNISSTKKPKSMKVDAPTDTHEDNSDHSMTLTNALAHEFSHPRFLTLNSNMKPGLKTQNLSTSPKKDQVFRTSDSEFPTYHPSKTWQEQNLKDLRIDIRNYDHPDFKPKFVDLEFLDPHMEKRIGVSIKGDSERSIQAAPLPFSK